MRRCCILILFALAIPGVAAAQSGPATGIERAVDDYVAPLVALDVFSGVVRVARGDSVLFEKAYGAADLELDVPLTVQSRFRIASITKPFTRALAGRLADRGVVDLDAPIRRWLPDFPEAERITLRLLLDHRAGVRSVNSLPYDEEAVRPNALADLVDSIARLPLDFEPGTNERYSNGGYALATRVLELAAGRPYARLVEEEILAPLGLRHTRSVATREIVPGLARGYAPSPDEFGRAMLAPFQEMDTKAGGGSLVSTAADLHRWALAVGRDPILRPTTWSNLFPDPDAWAYTGRSPGYNAALLREGDVVAVVLANNYAAGMTLDVAQALIDLAQGRAPRTLPVGAPVTAGAGQLAAAAGAYRLPAEAGPAAGSVVEVREREGWLIAFMSGTPVDVLVPQADGSFLLRSLWSAARFEGPVRGNDSAVVIQPLYRPGSYRAERVAEVGS